MIFSAFWRIETAVEKCAAHCTRGQRTFHQARAADGRLRLSCDAGGVQTCESETKATRFLRFHTPGVCAEHVARRRTRRNRCPPMAETDPRLSLQSLGPVSGLSCDGCGMSRDVGRASRHTLRSPLCETLECETFVTVLFYARMQNVLSTHASPGIQDRSVPARHDSRASGYLCGSNVHHRSRSLPAVLEHHHSRRAAVVRGAWRQEHTVSHLCHSIVVPCGTCAPPGQPVGAASGGYPIFLLGLEVVVQAAPLLACLFAEPSRCAEFQK